MIHIREKILATDISAATRGFIWIVSKVDWVELDLCETRRSHQLLTAHEILTRPSVPESNLLSFALILASSYTAHSL